MRTKMWSCVPVAAAMSAMVGCALAQTQPQTADQTRGLGGWADPSPVAAAAAASAQEARSSVRAPSPEQVAAMAQGTTTRIRLPGGGFRDVTTQPTTGGVIVVPETARAGTIVEDPAVLPETVFVETLEPSTVMHYETLIRAGDPRYSITTLHTPRSHVYNPYFYSWRYTTSPYSRSYHYDIHARARYDQHNRPFSTSYYHQRGTGYDPLGNSLHRSAQLRFHEASRPNVGVRPEFRDPSPRATTTPRHRVDQPSRDRGARSGQDGIRIRSAAPMGQRDRSAPGGAVRRGDARDSGRSPK